ncbi:MAG: SAM-dependent methyltransferase, partial [Candidatus Nitrosotenuis sp.]
MLWFIGIGITGPDSLSLRARQIISECDIVYFEQFTSPIKEQNSHQIRSIVKGEFRLGPRWLVEDGREILDAAQGKKVALLSYGDPYIA